MSSNKKHIRKRFYFGSMQLWIFLVIAVLSVFSATVLKIGIIQSVKSQRIKMRQNDIVNQGLIISSHISEYDYLSNPVSDMINSELSQLVSMYSGRILILNQNFKIITDTFHLDKGKFDISTQAINVYRSDKPYINYNEAHKLMEICLPIHSSVEEDDVSGLFMMSVSTDKLEEDFEVMNQKGNTLLFVVYAVSIFLAFFVSIFLTRPLKSIYAHLKNLADDSSSEPLSVYYFRETKLISDRFNTIYSRMKATDDSRQEFVSNVSHELKTPMASIKVLADSLMADENAPRELYREFLNDITAEIDRENRIITDLLSLVKLDKKAGSLDISQVNINEMIEKILRLMKPLADDSHIDIVFESFRPIVADVDELKLSQAIMNLVENAIKYNNDVGWVHVSVNSDYKYFYIKVSDNGIGIPAESLDHVFERFYRVDKSHSREINGTGLGLALTKSTVNLHHGSIRVDSVVGDGTTFDIRIPLVYSEGDMAL